MSVAWFGSKTGAIRIPGERNLGWPNRTLSPPAASLEEAVTVLFCLIDDAYDLLNPRGDDYGALKRLSDSEVITLALFLCRRRIRALECGQHAGDGERACGKSGLRERVTSTTNRPSRKRSLRLCARWPRRPGTPPWRLRPQGW